MVINFKQISITRSISSCTVPCCGITCAMISKTITAYFVTVQLLFGLDFGFFSIFRKGTRALAQFVSSTAAVFIVSIYLISMCYGRTFPLFFHTTEYVVYFLLIQFSNYSLNHFIKDLLAFDEKRMMKFTDNYVGFIIWFYTLLIYFIKFGIAVLDCTWLCSSNLISMVLFLLPFIPLLIVDVVPVANAMIYYNIYIRLNVLRKGLDSGKYSVTVTQEIFREIADCFDKMRLKHDNLVTGAYLINFCRIMASLYYYLLYIKKNTSWFFHAIGIIYPIHHTIQMIFPALFAEMIGVETDAMKMILHERLLVEEDEDETQRSLRFLRFLEGRRLLRKAWRLVPVDLQLPVSLLSISATYIIVVIQLTHLFE